MFHTQLRPDNRKLAINRKAISIFQDQHPANTKWGDASVFYGVCWCLYHHGVGQNPLEEPKGLSSCWTPFADFPHVCDGYKSPQV